MANKVRQSVSTNMKGITDQNKRGFEAPEKQFVAYTGTIAAANGTVDVVIDTLGYSYIAYMVMGSGNVQGTLYARALDGTKILDSISSTGSTMKSSQARSVCGGLEKVVITIADKSAAVNNAVKLEVALSHNG